MNLAHPVSLQQSSLFLAATTPQFSGETFSAAIDGARLESQQHQVEAIMADGRWRTLGNIGCELRRRAPGKKHGEASISARLRDMRRRGWTVERERTRPGSGLFHYRALKADVPAPRAEESGASDAAEQ